MKKRIASIIGILAISFATYAQRDLNQQPKPGPAPKVVFGKANKFKLKNGLQVIIVENHKLPRASASLTIDNKPVLEGNKAGVSSIMGGLMGNGTTSMSKDDFNERVDYLGARLSISSSGGYTSSLKKYFPEMLTMLADAIKNPLFSKEEFDKDIERSLEGLKSDEKSVSKAAGRVQGALLYGTNHPYGEFITKETIKNITFEDIKKNYQTYYKPNNAYLIITGDVKSSKIKKLVKELFSDWKAAKSIPFTELPATKNPKTTEINFVDMPNAVQSEVAVLNNINLKLGDKDYYAAMLANNILGGSGTARLFMNLREDKAYTYGAYSSLSQSRYAGKFKASAQVRNMVTDSSVVELQKEIKKIRDFKVTAEELKNAKAQYIGNFVMGVQKPSTVANFALSIAKYNLPKDFYEDYLENINKVTLEDVQKAAKKYFKADNARIVIVGKGSEVLENLEKTKYAIKYFDKYANPTTKPKANAAIPAGLTAAKVVANYFEAIGGKPALDKVNSVMISSKSNVNGMALDLVIKSAKPNKSATSVAMGGNVVQKIVFDGNKGYQEAQGRRMNFEGDKLEEMKKTTAPFVDYAYTKGQLDRIEQVDGKPAYVIKVNKTEVFYDQKSGLKVKEVISVKTPRGTVQIPTSFSNYKEVNGIKFPYTIKQKMGPMDMAFEVKEIKINTGVNGADFK